MRLVLLHGFDHVTEVLAAEALSRLRPGQQVELDRTQCGHFPLLAGFLLSFASDLDVVEDGRRVHHAIVLREEESGQNSDGAVETANVADHGEDSVHLSLTLVLRVRDHDVELELRHRVI